MRVKVIGIKKIDYVNRTNRQVTGTEIHTLYDDKFVDGNAVEKFYISNTISDCKQIKVGQYVNILFNQYGKVDFLQLAE